MAGDPVLDLDAEAARTRCTGDWVVIENRDTPAAVHLDPDASVTLDLPIAFRRVKQVQSVTVTDFGLSARVTRLLLDRGWPSSDAAPDDQSLQHG